MNADVSAQIIKQPGNEGEHNGVVMAVQDKPLVNLEEADHLKASLHRTLSVTGYYEF